MLRRFNVNSMLQAAQWPRAQRARRRRPGRTVLHTIALFDCLPMVSRIVSCQRFLLPAAFLLALSSGVRRSLRVGGLRAPMASSSSAVRSAH